MGEDIAAANVSRTYMLGGTNIAIFTFMLFFLYPRFESGKINPSLFQAHTDSDGCRDLLTRIRYASLLPVLAWRTNE